MWSVNDDQYNSITVRYANLCVIWAQKLMLPKVVYISLNPYFLGAYPSIVQVLYQTIIKMIESDRRTKTNRNILDLTLGYDLSFHYRWNLITIRKLSTFLEFYLFTQKSCHKFCK